MLERYLRYAVWLHPAGKSVFYIQQSLKSKARRNLVNKCTDLRIWKRIKARKSLLRKMHTTLKLSRRAAAFLCLFQAEKQFKIGYSAYFWVSLS